jgi:quercetin dioxygenase-like cupin family protein
MKRTTALALLSLIAVLALAVPAPLAFGQATGVTTAVERRIEGVDPPAVAEAYQSVLQVEPGGWTKEHWHNGPSYNTVIEGEVTLRIGETERRFGVGEGWVDEPGVWHVAGNTGQERARLIASTIVPMGIEPGEFAPIPEGAVLPPGPYTLTAEVMNAYDLARPLEVIQRLVELEPGATVPAAAQAGPSIVGVLEGSVSVDVNGTTREYVTEDSWVEPGATFPPYTAGDTKTRLAITTFAARAATADAPTEQAATAPAQAPR